MPAWQMLRPSDVASRFEALHGSALTPLIGLDEEIDLLLRRWARAKAGDGQVVMVSGEPGLGKSRITAALEECLHAEPHRCGLRPKALFSAFEHSPRSADFGLGAGDPPVRHALCPIRIDIVYQRVRNPCHRQVQARRRDLLA
jgi:hypothetical protein